MIVHLADLRARPVPWPEGSPSWPKCSASTRRPWATAVTWPTTGTRRSSSTRSGTSTGSPPGRQAGRAHHPRRRDPHPQRLRHRRPGAVPRSRRELPGQRRPTRSASAGPRSRRRRLRSARHPRLRVLATPGHTFTHLSYVLEAGGEVTGVFTGGSLLFGSTGRPDLLGPAHTGLARAQHAVGAAAGPRAARLGARSSRPTGSAASARRPRPRPSRPRSGRRSGSTPSLTLARDAT